MVHPVIVWFAVSLGVVGLSPGLDQRERGDPFGDDARETAPSTGVDEPPVHSTAEDVLKALQKRRRPNVVIPPGSARDGRGQSKPAALYPEGWAFVSRSGYPIFKDNMWAFVLDEAKDEPSLGLLPNAILEGMVRSVAGASSALHLVVSGELTVFQGENYLLPRLALRTEPRALGAPTLDVAGESTTLESDGSIDEERSAEDVVKMLQEQSPTQRVVPLGGSVRGTGGGNGATAARTLLPDGAPLVDRPGRLVDEGQWWTFAFESDSPDYPEPPMRLLPNQNLELMVEASQPGDSRLVFIVSGEATVFNGENYLLPRVVMRRIDTGNLRK